MDAHAPTATTEPATPGADLIGAAPRLGDYAITARLERRPSADVYEATHAATGAPRLVYVLRPGAMRQPGFVHRLAHEVDAARWMRHPAVAKVDPCADSPSGRMYVAVERPTGRSLAGVLAEGGRLGAGRVVRLGSRLVEALAEAHAVGLVHGRLTPAAVMVADGWDDGAHALVTLTGLGVGTVALDDPVVGVDRCYVSPEQRAGGEPDERSDVFGLAALLHHALFGAAPAEVDGAAAGGLRVDVVEHLPAAVVLAAARSADPGCRPASVKAFWEDLLDALVADAEVEAPAPAAALPAPPPDVRGAEVPTAAPASDGAPRFDDAMFESDDAGDTAFDLPMPAPTLTTPPSIATPAQRARRRVMTHALWVAVPLCGAAAAGWPLAGRGSHAARPAAHTTAVSPGEVARSVAAPAPVAAVAPVVAPAATPPDSAARTPAAGRDAEQRSARGDRSSARSGARESAAKSAPAAETARPVPGADVALPQIYLLPAEGTPRPAPAITRPEDFPDRLGRKPNG